MPKKLVCKEGVSVVELEAVVFKLLTVLDGDWNENVGKVEGLLLPNRELNEFVAVEV